MESIFDVIPLEHFVLLSLLLFCIGMAGVLLRRNMIIVFMSIELMLNAVNLLAVAFSSYRGDPGGQVFVFFVMVVAAAEVALGLGILVMIYRNVKSVDINALQQLKW
ncbi:NADH-quinone oxidoreductase subunit NuoK [Haliscomenobacter hydrossis]|uniref:NADH-quinone oxidoreductase subunit K n=1 Tax=Haliscomenobacter hydrossis (strain ATCC 27775 / DSM 1100 / LMG 10767 / O) TaxID=760192 RepID=F4KW40_HALH1|nr:NADH-quinone oxidoreductase subunit NuoK [Haliscomenobacter hydrossis]AEE48238.1 NAD(P)H-quinone oxidoreductase subunit 4L [Haliscomenobacter hydrossis DSM 1100]